MIDIILDERSRAEEAISENKYIGNVGKTLYIIAKYYYSLDYKKTAVIDMLNEFMIKHDKNFNKVVSSDFIESVANSAKKMPLVEIDGINITKAEMETIESAKGVMARKVLFTMLCLAKYKNAVNESNSGWISYDSKDIFTLANITMTVNRRSLLINELYMAGYIGLSKVVDNTSMQVLYINDESDSEVFVDVFKDLGNLYMMKTVGGFCKCALCGSVKKRTSNRQKYCPSCADYIRQNHIKLGESA